MLIAMVLVIALLVPTLAGCGDEEEETPSPTPAGPVKIGVIMEWSGVSAEVGLSVADPAIALMDWYINEKLGGISVGGVLRPVEFVKCDTESTVAGAANCATQLIDDENVSVLTLGGATDAPFYAVADTADPQKVAYVYPGSDAALLTDYDWTASVISLQDERGDLFADFLLNYANATSIALLGEDMTDGRNIWNHMKPMLEDAGVEITSESWVAPGTMDLTPYLTNIKLESPDVLFSYLTPNTFAAMYMQIVELGGWGDIQNFAGNEHTNLTMIASMPGALGSYSLAAYIRGSSDTGTALYEDLWAEKKAEDPSFGEYYDAVKDLAVYGWTPFVVAIEAIKLADSDDPAEVAEALRSGDLEADTPFGHITIGTDGSADVKDKIVQIGEGGQLTPVFE